MNYYLRLLSRSFFFVHLFGIISLIGLFQDDIISQRLFIATFVFTMINYIIYKSIIRVGKDRFCCICFSAWLLFCQKCWCCDKDECCKPQKGCCCCDPEERDHPADDAEPAAESGEPQITRKEDSSSSSSSDSSSSDSDDEFETLSTLETVVMSVEEQDEKKTPIDDEEPKPLTKEEIEESEMFSILYFIIFMIQIILRMVAFFAMKKEMDEYTNLMYMISWADIIVAFFFSGEIIDQSCGLCCKC